MPPSMARFPLLAAEFPSAASRASLRLMHCSKCGIYPAQNRKLVLPGRDPPCYGLMHCSKFGYLIRLLET